MSNTNRKRLRLEGYDYSSQGAYYVTVCTVNKVKILCDILSPELEGDDSLIIMTPIGKVVEEAIKRIPGIDKYVVMPNHVHMIILQTDDKSISSKIQSWKRVITSKTKQSIWQSSFYDHVIRDEADYRIKWKYIDDNPIKWASGDHIDTEQEM
jgi:REP element-mobilizing transposase RayT